MKTKFFKGAIKMELRKAVADDIAEIVEIYDKVLDNEE